MSLDRTRKLSAPHARTSRVSPSPRQTTPSSFTSNIALPLFGLFRADGDGWWSRRPGGAGCQGRADADPAVEHRADVGAPLVPAGVGVSAVQHVVELHPRAGNRGRH